MQEGFAEHRLILLVGTDPSCINPGTPALLARNEEEAAKLASELGKIFFADVNRLSNGLYIIKTPAR